jgi:hypothetical protein
MHEITSPSFSKCALNSSSVVYENKVEKESCKMRVEIEEVEKRQILGIGRRR